MTSRTINLVPPNTNPDSFCRLCFSKVHVTPLTPTSTVQGQNAVQTIGKHLGIQLTPDGDDFPCGLCRICEEKLEELNLCNADGLLDEWQDEDLLEYKASCIAVDEAIRSRRRNEGVKQGVAEPVYGDKRVVLPFHKLNDGRYKCNVCPDQVFEFISACIKHYQEVHPVSTLSEISTEPAQNSAIRGEKQSFSCVSCSARFENIDALIEHREQNHQRVKKTTTKRKAVQLEEPVVGVDSVVPTFMVAEGAMQYYQCIVCSAVVGSVLSLLEHRLLHVLDPAKQTTERWLSDSANVTLTNGFKCPYCIEQFVDCKAYYFHLNTVHDTNLCNSCGDACPSSSRLIHHQSTHRAGNDGPFACDLCSITVFTQAELDDHRLHHQTLIPIEAADESVLPAAEDECYFLDDGQGNEECILSDDHQEALQNGDLVEDACAKVVEISDDED
uniref:C2H2-type domain-containing protein n=2 Tax=Culex tarsalis TaxID=7177 RepID=A0A1Q3F201_CULTA